MNNCTFRNCVGIDSEALKVPSFLPWQMEIDSLFTTLDSVTTKQYRIFYPEMIINVEFYPPATKVFFKDGTVVTTVAQDGDEFNKETGIMTCIMKYIFGNKKYNNMLRKWIKNDNRRQKEKIAAIEKEKEDKAIKQRQREKERKRQAARAERAKQRAIEIQTEAYLRAMKLKEQESEQIARDSE